MIVVRGLQVNYKWHQDPVLKGVDATLDGKSLVLGPNGSGKTTLFRSICGLTNLSSGEILIDGEDMQDIYAKTSVLSTNFQEVYTLLSINSYDLVSLYADLANGSATSAYDMMGDLGLDPDFLRKHRITELSTGQAKAVCTSLALSMKARHVLLDEPFEQLDPAKKGKVVKYLDQYDGVVALNTHETWLLKSLVDWAVFFMFEGRLYGPLLVKDLLSAKISFSDEPGALLKLKVSDRVVSISRGEGTGTLLTSLENLDRIYELAEGGSE